MPPPDQSATTDPSTDPPADSTTSLGTVELLRQLTQELVAEALAAEGWSGELDDDGDLVGLWEQTPVYFRVANGAILQVTSFTKVDPAPADLTELYEFCNAWNRDRLWPKAYVTIANSPDEGERTVAVFGEATTHLPHGVTLDQLRQLVRCGVGTSCQLTTALTERSG